MADNVVKTDYGYDVVWANNELYCSKILVFEKQGSKTVLHFHKIKTKTWFVNAGKFKVHWVDTKDGKVYAQDLSEGAVFHIEPLTPVKLEALANNSVMAETGSSSAVDDFYRLG
jgi:quercetin dioxygenase-like cupin family protein